MLAALMALYGTADAFFGPAMSGLIPQTVAEHRVQEANALIGLTQNVGDDRRPGDRRRAARARRARARRSRIDAATFVASAIFLARLRPAEIAAAEPGEESRCSTRARGLARSCATALDPAGPRRARRLPLFVLPSVFVLGPAIAEQDLERRDELGGDLDRLRRRRGARQHRRAAAAAVAHARRGVRRDDARLAPGRVPRERPRHGGIAALELVAGVGVSIFFTLWDSTVRSRCRRTRRRASRPTTGRRRSG